MGHIPIYSHVLKTFTFLSMPHVHESIYGNLPPLSQKLAKWRLQFAGHCLRAMGEIAPVTLTMEAKWPHLLQKIDLSWRDSQGLRNRKVRSWERYGGPWSLEHGCCVRADHERRMMMMMMMMAHWRRYQLFCICSKFQKSVHFETVFGNLYLVLRSIFYSL